MIKFNKNLRLGMIAHKRSLTSLGKFLRWGMNKWMRRIVKNMDVPFKEVWGNHDGIVVNSLEKGICIGEALGKGSIMTPISHWEKDANRGKSEIRIYEVISDDPKEVGRQAALNWVNNVSGTDYNYKGYFRLLIKSMFFDWSNSRLPFLKVIGEKAAGSEWDNWCTQGVDRSFDFHPPDIDIFQTENATPMTTEQVAGVLPRKTGKETTLRDVTEWVIDRT